MEKIKKNNTNKLQTKYLNNVCVYRKNIKKV